MNERWERIEEPHEQTFHWILPSKIVQSGPPSAGTETSRHPNAGGCITSAQSSVAAKGSSRSHQPGQTTSHFAKWLEADDAPIFCISGKAACGKSTLMKYLHKRPEL